MARLLKSQNKDVILLQDELDEQIIFLFTTVHCESAHGNGSVRDTQTMIDQSEIALEIKDTLEVGHTDTSEVDPSHVAQRHKDIFALGVSHVR